MLARGFAALADPARLRVLGMIASPEAREVCVCEFVGLLRRSQPTISHHLKVFADAGLVRGKRRGRWVWSRLSPREPGDPPLGARLVTLRTRTS